jgi:hypothetical protein
MSSWSKWRSRTDPNFLPPRWMGATTAAGNPAPASTMASSQAAAAAAGGAGTLIGGTPAGMSTPQSAQLQAQANPTPVRFPRHLYPPENVRTLDIRIVNALAPGDTFTLINFTPQAYGITSAVYITQYAIFNNGILEEDYSFLPALNGKRIYPYHGNPNNAVQPGTFLISLGLAPDLSDYSLINGFFVMNPEDTLTWTATNNSTVITDMGVRVVGYIDQSTVRQTLNFGG